MTTKPKGVMIKDIDMPKNCFNCILSCFDFNRDDLNNYKPYVLCNLKKRKSNKNKRPSWCPLVKMR